MNTKSKKTVTFNLDTEVIEYIQKLGEEIDRSASWIVNTVLKDFKVKNEKKESD